MMGFDGGTRPRYWFTLVSGVVECLCFAGVLFGWASLVFVLKEDGYFGQYCEGSPNSTSVAPDCSRQDEQFSLVFTIGSFLNNFMTFTNGYIFDRFGTTVTRLLGIFLYTTGTLLVAFSSPALSEMLFPAMSCIGVGGILLLITNMQVGNLFVGHRSTVITLYNGAFDSSSAVFLIFKILYEQGVSLRTSFVALSLCSILHLTRTFLLMPRSYIPYPLPELYTYGNLSCGKANSYNVENFEKVTEDASKKECEADNMSPQKVSKYTNAFAITQLCGVLCAPWNGLIMDRHKGKPLAPGETEQEADLRSSVLSLFLTALQCLCFSVCASVPILPLQYLTFALQVLNRSFLFGGNAAFISVAFPACHFGKLYGLVMSLSAIVSLLQYPCFALVKGVLGGDPLYVNIALTILILLAFIHPINIYIQCRKSAQKKTDQVEVYQGTILAETTF
ncbi:solute carrier family 43 member 3a isoform X2 [Boleophthalmus pectinirostris]|uniref:solute carrier family 43 member 3a isoform X2 n=1 Tax=Boleophthalmus pectinirostris TaxID=150288 RepID=UPI0024305FB6|nr:solute carrier family 43 member 3a isoform X2 [Boleophthalmus pectinirostris]